MSNPTATLPTLQLDYAAGQFVNTMTGETSAEIRGVILGSRNDRVLWPALSATDRRPECVNGSVHGPCERCQFSSWLENLPPLCSEELSVLIYDETGGQAVVLTGRRTQAQVLDRYLGMKAQTTGLLHDQRVTVAMKPGDQLHRLIVLPGEILPAADAARMEAMAQRMTAQGLFEGLA